MHDAWFAICYMTQVTSLKIKYNPFAKAFQDNKDRFDVSIVIHDGLKSN